MFLFILAVICSSITSVYIMNDLGCLISCDCPSCIPNLSK